LLKVSATFIVVNDYIDHLMFQQHISSLSSLILYFISPDPCYFESMQDHWGLLQILPAKLFLVAIQHKISL